jgi:hypothetical protein
MMAILEGKNPLGKKDLAGCQDGYFAWGETNTAALREREE